MNRPKDQLVFEDAYELIEFIAAAIRHSQAYDDTMNRVAEAHTYVQAFCMPDGWGRNVWHTILDDAIRMRKATSDE